MRLLGGKLGEQIHAHRASDATGMAETSSYDRGMEHDTITTDQAIDMSTEPATTDARPIEDELLVEEISIDGMCGVY